MGVLVKATANHNTRPNYVVSDPPVVAVADGELAIWIGANLTDRVEAYNLVLRCLQALREAHWPEPITGEVSAARFAPTTGTIVVTNGTIPAMDANNAAVIRGFEFSTAGSSSSAHVRRMLGVYLEAQKAA